MTKSYQEFDRPYRRGLVLGLSLAELFLILLFLVLLASLGVQASLQQRLEREKHGSGELLDQLVAAVEPGAPIEPEEALRLLKEEVDEARAAKSKVEELQDQLREEQEAKEGAVARLEREHAKKGQHPPCWYVIVADADEPDGEREKHVSIFEVRIEDEGFFVRKPEHLPHNLQRGETGGLPKLRRSAFNRRLSEDAFRAAFFGFFQAGDERRVHDYRCRFMVDVYDYTSDSNKDGYKRNMGVVKDLFLTNEYTNRQWRTK